MRQLIDPQESPGRAFTTPSPLHPTMPRDTSSGLAPMGSDTSGDVRTGAPESRPQASSFGGAAPPPPPRAYLEGPGCPGAPGTWKGQRAQQRLSLLCLPSQAVNLGKAGPLRVLTSMRVSTWAQHRDRDRDRAAQWLRCHGAEPGSRKPPFPEET